MKTLVKISLLISFVFLNINPVLSQLKVESNGSLYVNSYIGDWGRANWTKVHYQNSCAYHLFNTYYGGDVFYVRGDGYVWTRNGWLTSSDSIFKTNIEEINSSIEKIKKLRGVTYNRKCNTEGYNIDSSLNSYSGTATELEQKKIEPKEYGLIAQEVEKVLPEAVVTMHDSTKAISYQSIIPVLIEAVKEQQIQIETLQKIIIAHEAEIASCKNNSNNKKSTSNSSSLTDVSENENITKAILFQNTPNPFSSDTEINYNVSNKAETAVIYIHDLRGIEIRSYEIHELGLGSIVINGSELNAGMYIYSLLVDNQIIDTKRMILTKN